MKDFKSMAGSLIQGKRAAVLMVAALLLLVLILLPFGLSWGLNRWLLANGGDAVAIEDIDVNLFTGKVSIEQLQLEADGRPHLKIPRLVLDIEWLPLFSKQVEVKSVLVDGVEIQIAVKADGSMTVGGVVLPDAGSEADETGALPWGFGLGQLEIINSAVSYQSPELQLDTRLDELLLRELKTWVLEPAPLVFEGAVNGARVSIDGHLPPLSDGFGYAGKLVVDALPLRTFASLAEAAVHGLEGALSVDTQLDVRLAPGRPPEISQQGVIGTNAIKFEYEEIEVAYASLGWDGSTRFAPASGDGGVQVNGSLKINGLDADTSAADKKIRLASIEAINVADIALSDNGH